MSFWSNFLADLLVPLRALFVALGGVVIALAWFDGHQFLSIAVLAIGIGLGRASAALGARLLPGRPVTALELLELSALAPAAVAAAAAAVLTVIGVEFSVEDPPELKALAGALTTGVTTFVSVMFMSWTADKDDSSLATFIQTSFRAHYKRANPNAARAKRVKYFLPESAGERWIYSDEFKGIKGWGREARRQRARGVAAELANAVE